MQPSSAFTMTIPPSLTSSKKIIGVSLLDLVTDQIRATSFSAAMFSSATATTSSSSSSDFSSFSLSPSRSRPSYPPESTPHYCGGCFSIDSLLNPLAPQDHIPLGITWVASWLLELITALLNPVPLQVVLFLRDQLTTMVLV
jgi:hypothetical protein